MITGKYQSYPIYKNSGIEWLGQIPESWKVLRGKFVFREFGERSKTGDETLLSVSEYYGVKPRGDVIDEGDFLSRAESLVGYKKCHKNDLVMNIMLAWKRGLGVTQYNGIVSPAYSVFRFYENASPGYMHYLLRTDLYTGHFKTRSTGVIDSRLRLYPESFANVPILIPQVPEQVRIANFLDHETAKIDTLIDKQQQLIKLLKEKCQAVISHAVTKGLNPDAPMKDSGVEWLGEVPVGWDVAQLGKKIQLQRGVDITKDEQVSGEIPVVSSGGISSFHNSAICEGPGVIVGRKGTAGKMHYIESCYWPHDTTLYVREFRGNNPRFVYYKLLYMKLETFDTGSANPTLNRNIIHPEKVSWPDIQEQIQISRYLDELSAIMDTLVKKASTAINLLQERRTALISAAVTGKIDVRNWQSVGCGEERTASILGGENN